MCLHNVERIEWSNELEALGGDAWTSYFWTYYWQFNIWSFPIRHFYHPPLCCPFVLELLFGGHI